MDEPVQINLADLPEPHRLVQRHGRRSTKKIHLSSRFLRVLDRPVDESSPVSLSLVLRMNCQVTEVYTPSHMSAQLFPSHVQGKHSSSSNELTPQLL